MLWGERLVCCTDYAHTQYMYIVFCFDYVEKMGIRTTGDEWTINKWTQLKLVKYIFEIEFLKF